MWASKDKLTEIQEETAKMMKKYPGRVVIYVDKMPNSKSNLKSLKSHKFLVPDDLSFQQFTCTIRKNLQLTPEIALFYFIGEKRNIMPTPTQTIGELYSEYKNLDGRLYVYYETESVFG